jgi:hypothetical protein
VYFLLTSGYADLTVSNIEDLQVVDWQCITTSLLTFVNSARVFSEKRLVIKKPPLGRAEVPITSNGLWCKQGVIDDMFITARYVGNTIAPTNGNYNKYTLFK